MWVAAYVLLNYSPTIHRSSSEQGGDGDDDDDTTEQGESLDRDNANKTLLSNSNSSSNSSSDFNNQSDKRTPITSKTASRAFVAMTTEPSSSPLRQLRTSQLQSVVSDPEQQASDSSELWTAGGEVFLNDVVIDNTFIDLEPDEAYYDKRENQRLLASVPIANAGIHEPPGSSRNRNGKPLTNSKRSTNNKNKEKRRSDGK
jgi:hypothetical protein